MYVTCVEELDDHIAVIIQIVRCSRVSTNIMLKQGSDDGQEREQRAKRQNHSVGLHGRKWTNSGHPDRRVFIKSVNMMVDTAATKVRRINVDVGNLRIPIEYYRLYRCSRLYAEQ